MAWLTPLSNTAWSPLKKTAKCYYNIHCCINIKNSLTQVYSHHPCEKTPDEGVFVKSAKGLICMWRRSNYDWMLFLTSPMAFLLWFMASCLTPRPRLLPTLLWKKCYWKIKYNNIGRGYYRHLKLYKSSHSHILEK